MFLERAQDWIEPFDVAHLKDEAAARGQFRKLSSMRSVIGNRFLNQHMFALGKESACNVVMSIGGRCYRSGVNQRDEIIERFGRCRTEFARNCAAPQRFHVVYRGEFSGWNLGIQPCMIASDMPNTNNANAQLFHWSPPQSTPKAFAGQRSKVLGNNLLLWPVGEKPLVSLDDAFSQRDHWLPAECANFAYVQQLSRCPVWFVGVPHEFAVETDYIAD